MIDTHCHLTFPDFAGRVGQVMADAAEAGVTGAITISTSTRDCPEALGIARSHPRVWCSAGVHPLYSHEAPHEWERLRRAGSDARCVAWGELGLDNHYQGPHRATQHPVLADQLAFIGSLRDEDPSRFDKPIVLHCREAFAELIPILSRTSFAPERFVFHCFTGTPDDMRRIIDFGAYVSFTGVVTYKNAPAVAEAARLAPLDRIMVETDAPFLTPAPNRGERPCEPRHARITANFLADLLRLPWEEFHAAINANTRAFFGVDPGPVPSVPLCDV